MVFCLTRFRSGCSALKQTSLTSAWNWGLLAQLAWLASTAGALFQWQPAPRLDHLWYWTCVLSLCPLISVLGARRPTNRVWNLFIILPLLAVLGWPALTELWGTQQLSPLRLQAPVYLGFVLVLVMGTGNYLGTRFGLPVVLAAVAVGIVLVPFSTQMALSEESTRLVRSVAALFWGTALWGGHRAAERPVVEESPFDRVWFDFRDAFGIVWSIRIQERINATARKDHWSSRLGPLGFEWTTEVPPADREKTLHNLEHALRWHLRRFVENEWIDQRLHPAPDEDAGTPA
ncbi:hypothetical protein [Planctomicrobium sp. SH664]|uniref:hypothetical protein n=1 Tax=Planctomicrobium sp. SH664 TaxID=3448125 RepID=UPI003F5B29E8